MCVYNKKGTHLFQSLFFRELFALSAGAVEFTDSFTA